MCVACAVDSCVPLRPSCRETLQRNVHSLYEVSSLQAAALGDNLHYGYVRVQDSVSSGAARYCVMFSQRSILLITQGSNSYHWRWRPNRSSAGTPRLAFGCFSRLSGNAQALWDSSSEYASDAYGRALHYLPSTKKVTAFHLSSSSAMLLSCAPCGHACQQP